jgi:hypothetical protein
MADKEAYRFRLHQAETVVEAHFSASDGVTAEHDEGQKTVAQCELWVGALSGRPELPALNAAVDELDSGLCVRRNFRAPSDVTSSAPAGFPLTALMGVHKGLPLKRNGAHALQPVLPSFLKCDGRPLAGRPPPAMGSLNRCSVDQRYGLHILSSTAQTKASGTVARPAYPKVTCNFSASSGS